MKYLSRTKAYNHQACALVKLVTRRGGALLMEPGTGKTKVAVDFCGRMYIEKGLRRVLVIAPLSAVMSIWEKEVQKHLGEEVPRRVIRLQGNINEKCLQVQSTAAAPTNGREPLTFILVNYESTWRHELEPALHNYNPECIIIDESHKIKNPTARQSKSVCKFNDARWRLILTGTPITKWPLDIFGQWKFLQPETFGTNWYAFQAHYAKFGGYKDYEVVGFTNLDELYRKAHHDAYIITKDECLTLPERTYQDIEVEMTPRLHKQYKLMEKQFYLALSQGQTVMAPITLTKMLRLSQMTGGFITADSGMEYQVGGEKLHITRDLLENYTYPDRKVVVFARFLWEIRKIQEAAAQLALNPVIYTGEVSPVKRADILERFQEDAKCKLFIAQIATGSLAIDLTVASTAIFYSLDYNLGNYIQACDRLHRHGQTQKVLYLHLLMKDTIDEVVYQALSTKTDLARLLIDHTRGRRDDNSRRPRRRG